MTILLLAGTLTCLGVVGVKLIDDWEHEILHMMSLGVALISGFILLILLVFLPINQMSGRENAERYNAIKETIENSREENIDEVERAALTSEIIEVNTYLASTKYWNEHGFSIFIYDGLLDLEPLK